MNFLLFLLVLIIENWIAILAFVIAVLALNHFKKYFIGPTLWDMNYYESVADELEKNPDAYTEEEFNEIMKGLDEDMRIVKEEERKTGLR